MALVTNRPNVNGSALLLRATNGVTETITRNRAVGTTKENRSSRQSSKLTSAHTRAMLCVSNRRSRTRIHLHTAHVGTIRPGLLLTTAASLTAMLNLVRRGGPTLTVISSTRAVISRRISNVSNNSARIQRITDTLVSATGALSVPIFLINRIAGSNSVTKPHALRRLISIIYRFRKSDRATLEVLETTGGHFNPASRIKYFSVDNRNVRRIASPTKLFLSKSNPRSTGSTPIRNAYIAFALSNRHDLPVRIRTLIAGSILPAPEHTIGNISPDHVTVLITILCQRDGLGLLSGSLCVSAVTKNRTGRPNSSLTVIKTLTDTTASGPVTHSAYTVKRVSLAKRIHPMPHVRCHLHRTTHLKFAATIVPPLHGPIRISKLGLIRTDALTSTLRTLNMQGW